MPQLIRTSQDYSSLKKIQMKLSWVFASCACIIGILAIWWNFSNSSPNIDKIVSDKFKCSKEETNYKCKLGTKTPYRFVANEAVDQISFKGCEAQKIWFMFRHGTRSPDYDILSRIQKLNELRYEIINYCSSNTKCNLSQFQIERLKQWKTNLIEQSEEEILVEEGENEMIYLGKRFKSRFPNLISEKFDNQTFRFRFTHEQRTAESAKHFAIGIFGNTESSKVWYPKAEKQDRILRFYKMCPKWDKEIGENPKLPNEPDIFINSSIVHEMLKNITSRIGINMTYGIYHTISHEKAYLIREMCAYETAWNKTIESPWCFFTESEFEIFEYQRDLKAYWTNGYGHSLNYEQACPAFVDMFDFFLNTNSTLKISAYFSHSKALLKMLAFLNIANDKVPLYHNTFEEAKNRQWRTSLIGSFATNLAFVLYNCTSGPGIAVLQNERVVHLPGCPENHPCPLDKMKAYYPLTAEKCEFEEICGWKNSTV